VDAAKYFEERKAERVRYEGGVSHGSGAQEALSAAAAVNDKAYSVAND
jgi:hypothetical protein